MSPLDESYGDAMRDALGMIEAAHRGDLEGGRVLLDNANLRLTAAALARIGADLIEDMTDDPAAAIGWLREHHAGGG